VIEWLSQLWRDLAPWLVELAIIVVFVAWAVGAYNRLMRLRNQIGAAWRQIDEQLLRRHQLLGPLLDALAEPMAEEAATLDKLRAASEQVLQRARALTLRPHDARLLSAWQLAEAEMGSPLARLLALLDLQPSLHADPAVAQPRADLAELGPRISYLRQLYNDAASTYNASVRQFPTWLLARLFGFQPAGMA